MKFDLTNAFEREKAKVYFDKLHKKGCKIELSEKQKIRSIAANNLFHLWIAVFAEHIGELELDVVKRYVKRALLGTREVVIKATGETQVEDFKTSAMSTKELSDFMDKFKMWADTEFGCYLPYIFEPGYEEMIEHYSIYKK